uniref:Uncharacterized protein n=1 Tax=Panagrolaimus sp. ES5 TaxID=591445 RepID=A0AC34F5S6_9BILA
MMNGSHMGNPSFNAAAVAAAIENNGNQIHGASNHSNTDLSKLAVSQTPQGMNAAASAAAAAQLNPFNSPWTAAAAAMTGNAGMDAMAKAQYCKQPMSSFWPGAQSFAPIAAPSSDGNTTLDTDIKPSVMAGSAGSDRSSPPDSLTAAYNGLNNPQMFNTSMMPQHYSASHSYYEWQALNQQRQMASHNFNAAAAAAVAAVTAVGHNGGGGISSPHSTHSGTTANNSTNVNNISTSTSSSVEAGHTNIGGVNATPTAAAAASSRSASSATAGGGDSTSIAGTSNESSANINNNNNNNNAANDGGDGSSHNHSNRDLSRNGFMNQAGNGSYAFDMMNHPMCQPELYNNVANLAAANPWAYPYPPYQFGGAPYGPGLDISSFGMNFFVISNLFFDLFLALY